MLQENIEKILNTQVRPVLNRHGGDIRVVSVEDGVVVVRLFGQCSCCPGLQSTMDELVRAELLQVEGVKDVRLDASVSDDLIEMAKRLIRHEA